LSTLKNDKLLKLEYYRKKYGFTQAQFGKLIGLKASAASTGYSSRINRRSPIRLDEMKIITAALNKAAAKAGDPLLTMDEIFLS
jgi:transcriptional regulator with XRE-family HTH domain